MTGRILQNGNIIEVRQGDSFTIRIAMKKNNQAIDLTGAKVNMQVRDAKDDRLMFDLLATEIDVRAGLVALIITPDMSKIDVGDYKTDIQVSFPDGSINTIFPADINKLGIFRVTEQVTR